jgi:lipopolysaccharide export system protein LptC
VKLSSARLFPLAIMFVLALITVWLERAVREEETHPSLRRHDPDWTVDNFRLTTYARDGAPESMLSAAKMLHYPDDDTTELIAPHVVQSKPSEPRMTLSAARGALSRDGEEIFLYDDVVLVREAHGGRPAARLTTSFLHLPRGRSLARTDREVTIVEGDRSLSGRGMEYDNEAQRLELRSQVRGRFEPKEAKP